MNLGGLGNSEFDQQHLGAVTRANFSKFDEYANRINSDRIKTMLDLLDVFYKNHELFYRNSFQVFLFQINDSMQMKQSIVRA